MKQDMADKPKVMAAQRKLLESRYNLTPHLDPAVKMSRGKPICVGPTARLKGGLTWDATGRDDAGAARRPTPSPTRRCRTPSRRPAARCSRRCRSTMFPRLERFDVDFDLPEAFLPEFPPAIFLQNRPGAGRRLARRGRLDQQLLRAVQGHPDAGAARRPAAAADAVPAGGVQPDRRPQERRSRSLGVACFDCHVNGHTTGQFHLNPDDPARRSGGSGSTPSACAACSTSRSTARSGACARSRTSPSSSSGPPTSTATRSTPMKKGFMNIPTGSRSRHMAQMQNMFDFPPAPEARPCSGRLDPTKATESELRGEELFFGKGQCARLPPGPVLPGPPDARPAPGAVPRTSRATARSRPSPCAASRTARPTCTTAAA